ncbi:MAG: HAMP domain-containing sensor histidine kinase [Bryobacteraceae bacterium]
MSTADPEELRRELEAARAKLAEARKMASLGQLLAALVHEISTPIGSLRSNNEVERRSLDALRKLVGNSAEAASIVETMTDLAAVDKIACERLAAVVRGARDFSSAARGDLGTAQVNDLIENALKVAEWTYRNRITVERDYGELPAIECYPGPLGQAFLNLLVNAGQAIEGQGTVTVRTLAEGGYIHVSVSDTGRGIQPEDRLKIFTSGFSTKPSGEGAGLGLSITQDIVVELHGGAIDFESQPGAGTTFHVRVPTERGRKHGD